MAWFRRRDPRGIYSRKEVAGRGAPGVRRSRQEVACEARATAVGDAAGAGEKKKKRQSAGDPPSRADRRSARERGGGGVIRRSPGDPDVLGLDTGG